MCCKYSCIGSGVTNQPRKGFATKTEGMDMTVSATKNELLRKTSLANDIQ